jgi:hypothetical protein
MKSFNLIIAIVLMTASIASGETERPKLSFLAAWTKINGDSAAQDASRLQTESLIESENRAGNHWLPKVYLDAKTYQTNDPGASFFGLLQQRSLKQLDFNPDSINHPDSQLYTRGALGLDLGLYEGGMKSSQTDLYRHSVASQKSTTSQIQIEQYSAVGLSYGSIAVIAQQTDRLQTLSTEVARMIKGYQLGNKSNPVGYSGLLGMKSLANRISGLINQYEAQGRAYYGALREMGLKDENWSAEPINSGAFIDRYFTSPSIKENQLSSYKIDSSRETALAAEEVANMEKARFRPRIGAFAETFVFNGNRDSATGSTAGLYLQWSLFDPADYGGLSIAKLRARAAAKATEAADQQERAERIATVEQIKSLRQIISLLEDSQQLLSEQSRMTGTLFRNGSINALQLVELLNRRADLIAQQTEAELGLVKAGAQLVTKQKFEIAGSRAQEQKNEK